MAVQNVPGYPFMYAGAVGKQGLPTVTALGSTTLVTAKDSVAMIGRIYTSDGGSHTIDTTGSSSFGWRTGTSTFANGSTTVTVGIATPDAATGPVGRATNVSDAITFGGARVTFTAPTGITSAAWQTSVPTAGTSTIANGDEIAFCVQLVTKGGADQVLVSCPGLQITQSYPMVSTFLAAGGSVYASASQAPNVVITFSDGAKGYFVGGQVASIGSTATTWNNASAQKEYGNILQFPFPTKIFGVYATITGTADFDLNIYSDPLHAGAGPTNVGSVSFDVNKLSTAAIGMIQANFATPYSLAAATNIAVVARPTSASNIVMAYQTFASSADQGAWQGTGYAVSRGTVAAGTAFADTNSSKDRYAIGLLLGGFDDGAQTGGGASRSRVQLGH